MLPVLAVTVKFVAVVWSHTVAELPVIFTVEVPRVRVLATAPLEENLYQLCVKPDVSVAPSTCKVPVVRVITPVESVVIPSVKDQPPP